MKHLAMAAMVILPFCQSAPKAPDWTRGPEQVQSVDQRRHYGVGIVEGVQDLALAQLIADNRARLMVAEQLGERSGEVLSRWECRCDRCEGPLGPEIVERWRSPDGTTYALAYFERPPRL